MSAKTCTFWLQGKCTFGATCRNKHGDSESTAQSLASSTATPACPHFLRGNCKFGDQCHFPHLLPSRPTTNLNLNRSPLSGTLREEKTPHISTTSWRARQAAVSSRVAPYASPTLAYGASIPPCSHFLFGTCRFGDQCRLSHEIKPPTPVPAVVFGACKFFQSGLCSKLDCPFPHVKQAPTTSTFTANRPSQPPLFIPPVRKDDLNIPVTVATVQDAMPDMIGKDHVDLSIVGVQTCCREIIYLPVSQPPASTQTDTERLMMGCKISFGPGASIISLVTAFESPILLLSDIPADASEETLLTLLETFGDIRTFSRETLRGSARVEFHNSREASNALEGLSDSRIGSRSVTLPAKFELGAVQTGTVTLRSTKVKLSFFAPSFLAYAHYSAVTKARAEARRLDAMVFEGTTIRAEFQSPSRRQSTSFTVIIKGLPIRFRSGEANLAQRLKTFTNATSVTIGDPTYQLNDGVIRCLRARLETLGRLESLDVSPPRGTKVAAWAQFASSDAAAQATTTLHQKPLRFLGNSPVWAEQVHALRFSLPSIQFLVVKDELDRLSATLDVTSKLRYHEYDQEGAIADPVVLRLYSSDAKSLAHAKAGLDSILQGERVLDDLGAVVWNGMLTTGAGSILINEVHRVTSVYVECNTRLRSLRLHGPPPARSEARAMILRAMGEARENENIIPLERGLLRSLLSGGFRNLQEEAKDCDLQLDIVSRTITVRGDALAVASIKRALTLLASGQTLVAAQVNAQPSSSCPVCFCEIEAGPITLTCGHTYDTECLRLLAQSSSRSSDFSPLLCVAEIGSADGRKSCATAISLSQIRELLGPEEESRLLEASTRAHISAHPDEFHYCPTPDCAVVYRPARAGTTIRCPSCLVLICAHCHVEEHVGLSCAEHKDSLRPHAALFARWKAENGVKSCPRCSADIQKNGGCNHITCAGCKTHICWVCMKTFDDQDTSGGVYAHMRKAHGGIGLGY